MSAADWTDDREEVLAFATALDEAGAFSDTGDVIGYFASPQDWTPEHTRWVCLGKPEWNRMTGDTWDVILDHVSLSPEAEDAIKHGIYERHVDPRTRLELVEAGLVEEDSTVPEYVTGTHYVISAAGRVYAEQASK